MGRSQDTHGRGRAAALAVLTALAAAGAPARTAAAQAAGPAALPEARGTVPPPPDSVVRRMLAGCLQPAPWIEWDQHVVLLALRTPGRGAPQLPQMYRLLLLEDIATRMRPLISGRSAAGGAGEGGESLPSADGRYGPTVLGSRVYFTLRGDGSISHVPDPRPLPVPGVHDSAANVEVRRPWPADSQFDQDLRRTLDAMVAERAIVAPPEREPGDSVALVLYTFERKPSELPVRLDSARAAWALFTLTFPRAKMAAPAGGGAPKYPDDNRRRGFSGTVILSFVVDEHGRADTASARDLRPPGAVPPRYEREYQSFVRSVIAALPRMKYHPAEYMGCRVKQLVRQPFAFALSR